MINYLAKKADSVQLVVIGAQRTGGARELVGPHGLAVLQNTDCTFLTCDRRQRL